jgi:hypothetical protein
MLEELLTLLSMGDIEAEALAEMCEFIEAAPDNPEFDWIDDAEQARAFAIYDQLGDFIAESDKIDELHEQMVEWFASPLPPFPHDDEAVQQSSFAYFRWLDAQLAARAPEEGGYQLLSLELGLDDMLRVLLVWRRDVTRILELATAQGLRLGVEDGREPWAPR